jgi:NitT/TauT family transport system substrate-binding protein
MKQSSTTSSRTGLRTLLAAAAAACGLLAAPAQAQTDKLTKVVLGTSWFAQAEHGGFYQAKATGLYEKHGLDVSIKMGGPQVNGLQLLVAGQYDFTMGYPIRNLNAVQQGLPVVTVAAAFQKDPQVLIAHPHVKTLEEIKGRTVLLSTSARATFWPWLQAKYGFSDANTRPYTFSLAPFLADKELAQQGYVSSEPYAAEQGGVKPNVFLLGDHGYPSYSATIETTQGLIKKNPDLVRRFVQASLEGWQSYFANPAPGNELIKKDNPQMTDAQIAYGIAKMKQYGLVNSGDAATKGIGYMTDGRWEQTFAFLANAGLLPKDLDYKKAYTTEFLPKSPVLPAK